MTTLTSNDTRIRHDVIAEIEYDPIVAVEDIGLIVDNGIVTLNGTTDSYAVRLAAERAAWRVLGVRDVVDNIRVDPRWVEKSADEAIAADL